MLISRLDFGLESWFVDIFVAGSICGITTANIVDTCRMRIRKEMIMILVFMVLVCALEVDMGCNFFCRK